MTRWPLVVTAPTKYVDDPDALVETYRQYDALLARKSPFLFLFDLRGYKSIPMRRRRFNDWYKANTFAIQANVVAVAAVVGNPLEAGIVTAYIWLLDSPVPLKVTSSRTSAEQWLRQQLSARTPAN
jgi:hypothetical protein